MKEKSNRNISNKDYFEKQVEKKLEYLDKAIKKDFEQLDNYFTKIQNKILSKNLYNKKYSKN